VHWGQVHPALSREQADPAQQHSQHCSLLLQDRLYYLEAPGTEWIFQDDGIEKVENMAMEERTQMRIALQALSTWSPLKLRTREQATQRTREAKRNSTLSNKTFESLAPHLYNFHCRFFLN
jgi:hypothetical protein